MCASGTHHRRRVSFTALSGTASALLGLVVLAGAMRLVGGLQGNLLFGAGLASAVLGLYVITRATLLKRHWAWKACGLTGLCAGVVAVLAGKVL